jgi:hypothetical protein
MKKELLKIEDVCQQIPVEDAGKILGVQPKTVVNMIYNQKHEDQQWAWIKGITYFQLSDRGNLMFNKWVLTHWQIAKSQGDVSIYLNAISKFQIVVKG